MSNIRIIIVGVVILFFISACGQRHVLNVQNGSGQGNYASNALVKIESDLIKGDSIFEKWEGGMGYIQNVYDTNTILEMPEHSLSIKATYRHKLSSGVADLDLVRKDVKANKTRAANLENRRAALFRWYRLLWRQGYNLKPFDELAKELINDSNPIEKATNAMDAGFAKLEELFAQGDRIEEIKGEVSSKESGKTNWAGAFGTDGSQRGYSPDEGPSEGKIDWKFAKGYISIAKPVIEDGKIYVSSPGIDVMGYCLDEKTGEVEWTARQLGTWFYGVHSCRQTPVVTDKFVFYRTGGEETPKFVVDKSTGLIAENISNQKQYTAFTEKGKSIVMFDADSGDEIWQIKSNEFVAEQPAVGSKYTYLSCIDGKVLALANQTGDEHWSVELNTEVHGKPTKTSTGLYVASENQVLYKLDAESGKEIWSFKSDDVENKAYRYYSAPIEEDGIVYIGAASKYLYALSAETGKLIWKKELSDWIRSAPVLVNEVIYVASLDGKLHALKDKGNNAELLFSRQINEHGFTADLSGSEDGILAVGRDLIIYSLSPKTGYVNWKHGVLNGAFVEGQFYAAGWSGGLLGSPTIVDDVVYIGGPDGFVNALNSETGTEIWRFETNSTTSLAPTVAESKVFFGYLGSFTEHYGYAKPGEYFALDKNTGEPIWTSKEFGKVWVSAAYNKGNIYFGNVDGTFYGVNASSGEKLWEYYTGKNTIKETMPKDTPFMHGYPAGVYCCPAIDDNQVYTGSWAGYYFAFDQKTGKLNWRTKTQGHDFGGLPDSAAPSFYKGNLYVQKKGGMIAALDRKTGKLQWEVIPHLGYLQNATIVAHNNKIFGSASNRVTRLPFESLMMAFSDVENGSKKIWEQRGPGGLTPPVLTNKNLISGSSCEMFVTCLEQETGKIKWRVFTGGEMLENGPAIYGNRFYALGKNGYLFAIK